MTSRVVIAALVTALVGGSAAWLTWAKEQPSERVVERIVDAKLAEHRLDDPYRADAKLLEFRLEQNTHELEKVKETMQKLDRDVGEIMTVLKALSSQIEGLADHLQENDG